MNAFETHTGIAAPFPAKNIDTDVCSPSATMRQIG